MSQALKRLLTAAGWEVAVFDSGEDFLAATMAAPAACYIIDVELPGISGIELCRRLSPDGNPVFIITGNDQPALRELSANAGAAGYFAKPFHSQQLLEAVRQHLAAA